MNKYQLLENMKLVLHIDLWQNRPPGISLHKMHICKQAEAAYMSRQTEKLRRGEIIYASTHGRNGQSQTLAIMESHAVITRDTVSE